MNSATETQERGSIRSVLTALRVLEALSQGALGVSELARAVGLPKTTAYRNLRTLAEAGWVRPSELDRTRWVLTSRPLTIALAGSVEGGLREVARAEMTKLRDATGETVHLAIADPPAVVIVARVDGTQSIRTFLPLGAHAPLHATASGRALLAAMPDEEVERILAMGLDSYTSNTILDPGAVRDEVAAARTRGFATNRAEWRSGIGAVGVAITSRKGAPVGALAISMPLARYEEVDLEDVARLTLAAARRIGEQMHDWQQSDALLGLERHGE